MEYARKSIANDKKAWNSVPNHFAEEKNTGNFIISFRTILRKVKMLRILFQTISKKRKHLEFRFEPLSKRKKFESLRWFLHDAFFSMK
jgi:hypothetical protein